MKIDSSPKPIGTGNASSSRPRPSAGSPRSDSAAEVKLSPASTELAASGSGAPVDSARIAEIKQAISEGRFTINAEAIADGLIETARDLLHARQA